VSGGTEEFDSRMRIGTRPGKAVRSLIPAGPLCVLLKQIVLAALHGCAGVHTFTDDDCHNLFRARKEGLSRVMRAVCIPRVVRVIERAGGGNREPPRTHVFSGDESLLYLLQVKCIAAYVWGRTKVESVVLPHAVLPRE
jgi:hypothetical protein